MTDIELLLLRSISDDSRMIAYRPRLRKVAGSVTATILLQQIVYRWEHNNFQPFYKYKEPCAAPDCRKGDSWTEELGFSREEFDTALKQIGQKVKSEALKDYSKRDHTKLVWYWVMPDRKTWYEVNYVTLCNVAIPLYVQRDSRFTSGDNPTLPLIYTKNTSESTSESKGGEVPSPAIASPAPESAPQPPPPALATQSEPAPATVLVEPVKAKPEPAPTTVEPVTATPAPATIVQTIALAEEASASETFDRPAVAPALPAPTRSNGRVTSLQYDPRQLQGGYIPAGTGTTPVAIYFERYSPVTHKLTAPQQDDLARVVTDMDRWRAVVVAWDQAGNKSSNIGGMLDWYRDPSRMPSNRHASATYTNGAAKPAPKSEAKLFKEWLLRRYGRDNLTFIDVPEPELRAEYEKAQRAQPVH
jgi:hypothetical protein